MHSRAQVRALTCTGPRTHVHRSAHSRALPITAWIDTPSLGV
uniref:Uncharacterized protein n=1 Tax=Siphoviridae sp. ctLKg7 TaxID=2825452 RepID=A0A8S5UVK5_9CAUD|nr:MAG TPA: hypothetical protein [Siphoviridae sp. ctLKg7]